MNQENLLPFNTPQNNNIQNFTNVEENNQNTLTFYRHFRFMFYSFTILYILAITLFLLYVIKKNEYGISFGIIVLVIAIFFNFLYLLRVKKVILIKNVNTNQLTIKKIIVAGCFKQYTLMLENRYLHYRGDCLFLLNTCTNLSEIDLDNSNIKNAPFNLVNKIISLPSFNESEEEIRLKIDKFLGRQKYENTIYDEIDKYITIYQKNY